MSSLDLGIIGNCTISALIDRLGTVVWSCFPRFDGDPLFCKLLDDGEEHGFYSIELDDLAETEQHYLPNTAVLVTRLTDRSGDGVEITDFAPRFLQFGRIFRPTTLMRIVRPFGETPRIRIRLRPVFHYGEHRPEITRGSNHIRYVGPEFSLRLTTNAPLTYVLDETPFILEDQIVLMLGPDESLRGPVLETGREFFEQTIAYWRTLTMRLSVPFEWQDAVIRERDHAQALQLRGDRRDRRRDDHLDPRDRRPGPQLGLSLLLAAGRLLRGPGAQPARLHRDHGGFPRLHQQHRRRQRGRPPAAGLRHRPRGEADRAPGGRAQGLSRQPAGPGRQPGLRARPARRLRLGPAGGDPGVLRPAAAPAGREAHLPPARDGRRPGLRPARGAGCGLCGSSAPRRASTPTRA